MNVRLDPPLRRATREDSRRVAELMNIAGHGLPAYVWSLSADSGQEPIEVGTGRAAREDGNFSYRNAVVVEEDGQVVAMLLAYRLPEDGKDVNPDELPEVLRPLVELELLAPGSFCVNGLAVLPAHRGRGLGSRLLDVANDLAAEAGCDELSLEVFEQNEGALGLYERYGYQIAARRRAAPHSSYPYDGDVLLLTREVIRS